MDIEIVLKNYRCFSDEKPARFQLRNGFTALVGANNAGKSSLIKFFYEFRSLFQSLSAPTGNLVEALYGTKQSLTLASSVMDYDEIYCNSNERDLEIQFQLFPASEVDREAETYLCNKIELTIPRGQAGWTAKIYARNRMINADGGSRNLKLNGTVLRTNQNQSIAQVAPIFDMFQCLSKGLYVAPFRNAINVGSNDAYFDIKVGQSFIQQWREFKTGNLKRNNESIYKLTEDIKHIFRFKDLEINPSQDDKSLQIFVDGKSYKLAELGSGLTQFILVLASAAIKQPTLIFIDEPELNLHPSLQLDFLTTLGSYADEGIVFATHSLGLAKASGNLVYSIRKSSDGKSEIKPLEATPRLSEFMGELSFSGYQELGFDRVLLVEGSTDVATMQQFLRQLRKDHEVLLLPLGGSQAIKAKSEVELQEITRITPNIFALIDSERESADKPLEAHRQAFVDTCKIVGIECHVLERRATENYFTDTAIKRVKGESYKALLPYENIKNAQNGWAKSDNWRIAREMNRDELLQTDLGKFLESL